MASQILENENQRSYPGKASSHQMPQTLGDLLPAPTRLVGLRVLAVRVETVVCCVEEDGKRCLVHLRDASL